MSTPSRRAALALLAWALVAAVAGCASCPPAWVERPPASEVWWYAAGSAGEVCVEADPERLALERAGRRLAERLGLDVESRLSIVRADGRLWVEARGAAGPVTALDALEWVAGRECGGVTYVLVRLPRG